MWIHSLRSPKRLAAVVSLVCFSPALFAQAVPKTPLQRQLDRVDFAINGVGEFSKSVRGTNYQGVTFTQKPSNTLGALVTLRYTARPLIGFEFNYGYARYTEHMSNYSPLAPTLTGDYLPGGAQTRASEVTFGYVAHGPDLLSLHTFASVGVGSFIFTPTTLGGQGLPQQVRALYYYDVGVDHPVLGSDHFGVRAQFRQKFYTAPDFGQNYLTIRKQSFTTEPGIGFYVKF